MRYCSIIYIFFGVVGSTKATKPGKLQGRSVKEGASANRREVNSGWLVGVVVVRNTLVLSAPRGNGHIII